MFIEQMITNQVPILRYAGLFVIGFFYVGTDHNSAIQKLLHFTVSDVSDDVRRIFSIFLYDCRPCSGSHILKLD